MIPASLKNLPLHLGKIDTDQIVLVCDRNIELIYAPLVQEIQSSNHLKGKSILCWHGLAGESNKTFEQYEKCTNQLLSQGVHRKSHLVALGGGGLSDFAGFVAATLLRGISWSIIPTTLLAQIDAAIGGKTAINSPHGKNLLGKLHFPENIFSCQEFLMTLEPGTYQSGLGELVKYALLSKDIFNNIMAGIGLNQIIPQCAKFKQNIVAQDLYEQGERKYLNLGHTFGHAYEFLTKEPHGTSILWGIEYVDKNFQNGVLREKYSKVLEKLQISPHFLAIEKNDLIEYFHRDKKRISQNKIQLVLLKEIGRPYLKTFPINQLSLS